MNGSTDIATDPDSPAGLEARLAEREAKLNSSPPEPAGPLNLKPSAGYEPHSKIPNTLLAVSTISFLLGCVFSIAFVQFSTGTFRLWWATYRLAFFVAAWSAFHWGEFAVTAGWNRHKCSVDCE